MSSVTLSASPGNAASAAPNSVAFAEFMLPSTKATASLFFVSIFTCMVFILLLLNTVSTACFSSSYILRSDRRLSTSTYSRNSHSCLSLPYLNLFQTDSPSAISPSDKSRILDSLSAHTSMAHLRSQSSSASKVASLRSFQESFLFSVSNMTSRNTSPPNSRFSSSGETPPSSIVSCKRPAQISSSIAPFLASSIATEKGCVI